MPVIDRLIDAKRRVRSVCREAYNVGRTTLAQYGLDRGYQKIFAIGFNKTATNSIHTLFLMSGIHSLHNWARDRRWLLYHRYQAFCDGPEDGFEELDRRFPGSKFILNTRQLDEWIDSRLEHIRYQLGPGEHPQTPDWSMTEDAVKNWIRKRNRNHIRIMEYFEERPQDLLIVNFIRDPEAARRIREFVGVAPGENKPYSRPIPKTRDAGVLKNHNMIEHCFDALGIPEAERQSDLYCASLVTDRAQLRFPADTTQIA